LRDERRETGDGEAWNERLRDLKPEKTTRFVSRESRESFGFSSVLSVRSKRKTDINSFSRATKTAWQIVAWF